MLAETIDKTSLFPVVNATKDLFYETQFKKIIFIDYLTQEIEEKGRILIPKEIIELLFLNEKLVNNMIPLKTKVIHQPRHYDYENEQWIGNYSFWFELVK